MIVVFGVGWSANGGGRGYHRIDTRVMGGKSIGFYPKHSKTHKWTFTLIYYSNENSTNIYTQHS